MKIRQAKKIIYGRHWMRYCQRHWQMVYDEERAVWRQPSLHDIPNQTYQRARKKYFGAARKFYNRHGYCFDDKSKGGKWKFGNQ